MNSCFYECEMTHARFFPRRHRFAYRIFLFAIDLDELEALHNRVAIFSFNRWNVYSFRDRDYLPTHEAEYNSSTTPASGEYSNLPHAAAHSAPASVRHLKQRVLDFLEQKNVSLTDGRIVLVTLPRVFGILFNPVSFYYCYDRHGEVVATLAEVTNTFREMKLYFLGPESRQRESSRTQSETSAAGARALPTFFTVFRRRVAKNFYVSPFSDVDVAFDFKLQVPAASLNVQIDDYAEGRRTFASTLIGRRRELTSRRLAWFTIKYPLITLRILTGIHWHALQLWIKRVPWFPKAARASEQREVYRAHVSLRPPERATASRPSHPAALSPSETPVS